MPKLEKIKTTITTEVPRFIKIVMLATLVFSALYLTGLLKIDAAVAHILGLALTVVAIYVTFLLVK
jgi:hypothetical protein